MLGSPTLYRVCTGLLLGVGLAVSAASAQDPLALEEFQLGEHALERGDTASGLTHLERAIGLDPSFAAAHFRIGQIHAHRATGDAGAARARLAARRALQAAVQNDPQNPRYLLELAKLMLQQQIRLDGRRYLNRALSLVGRADAETAAEIHFQLALFEEAQWQRFRYRHIPLRPVGRIDPQEVLDDPDHVWQILEASSVPGEDHAILNRTAMLEHLEAALAAHPGHVGAASHMLAYHFDERQEEEYLDAAHAFVRAAPDSPLAHLALGLGLTWTGDVAAAAAAFERGLALLPPEQRSEVEYIGRLMTRERERDYAELPEAERADAERIYWQRHNPLFLSAVNEYWLDYMARMTFAAIRFGAEEYGIPGWNTDRGSVYVRYGPPARIATFAPTLTTGGLDPAGLGSIMTIWSYGRQGPAFVFRQNPGYRNAAFATEFRWYAGEYRTVEASRLLAPTIPELHPVALQAVRFRGEDTALEVEVHALLPLARLGEGVDVESSEIEFGLFVKDSSAREHVRQVRSELIEFGPAAEDRLETWRFSLLAESECLVSVEALEPLTRHAAVGRATIEPRLFAAGRLALSDVLLADAVEPLVPEPRERSDYRISANPRMSFEAGKPIGFYFEVYELVPDDDEYWVFEIELAITLEQIDRAERNLVAQLAGDLADRWGFTPVGTDAAEVRFEKQARVLAGTALPEYFSVQLPGAPAGDYTVRITVRDRIGGAEVLESRGFKIR